MCATSPDFSLITRFNQPAGWQWGHVRTQQGDDLRWGGSFPPTEPKAHIIYVEGLSEFAEKTFEMAHDFNAAGYGFWVLDRKGQGASGRLLREAFKAHSNGFKTDAEDLVKFRMAHVPFNVPVILLGHSTGALVSLMALHDRPELFDGAIMTAPLLGLQHAALKGRERLAALLPLPRFIREAPAFQPAEWMLRTAEAPKLKAGDFSSDPLRMLVHDYWMQKKPDLRLGAPTYGWIQSVCQAVAKVTRRSYLNDIKKPLQVFTVGHEYLVNNSSVFAAFKGRDNVDYHHIPDARHEILMEADTIRKPLLQAMDGFIKKIATNPRLSP